MNSKIRYVLLSILVTTGIHLSANDTFKTSATSFKYKVDILPWNSFQGKEPSIIDLNDYGDAIINYVNSDGIKSSTIYLNTRTYSNIVPTIPGDTFAVAINNNKQVVGRTYVNRPISGSTDEEQRIEAFMYDQQALKFKYLGTLPEERKIGASKANAINNDGQCVGDSSSLPHAVIFNNGQVVDIGFLGGLEGKSTAFAINNIKDSNGIGQIVGGTTTRTNPFDYSAFLYQNGVMTDISWICPSNLAVTTTLKQSKAIRINDYSRIIGVCEYLTLSGIFYVSFFYDTLSEEHSLVGFERYSNQVIDMKGELIIGLSGNEKIPFISFNGGEAYKLEVPTLTNIKPVAINIHGEIAANTDQGMVILRPAFQKEDNTESTEVFGGTHQEPSRGYNQNHEITHSEQVILE